METNHQPGRRPGGAWPRRTLMQLGLLGPLGLSLPVLDFARAARAGSPRGSGFGRARRCILVFLNGGPSQLDLWDMKPAAPADVRGELQPIATVASGIFLSELLPLTARQIDRFKIVRSVTHEASVHTTAVYTMLTGTFHPTPSVDQLRATPEDRPHLGSIVAMHLAGRSPLPPFACLPSLFQAPPVEGIWPGQTAGVLGRRFDPLVVPGDKTTTSFRLPEIDLPADIPPDRLTSRRALLAEFDRAAERAPASGKVRLFDQCAAQAFDLLGAAQLTRAARLELEPDRVHERYGRHLFGQGLLLARRLIEAGLPLVTVYWNDPTPAGEGGGEYDSHGRIYWHMRNRLVPPTDRGLAALFGDLAERGLLEETLVVVMGEFGRTPRINKQAGRDHWPLVQSILMAGAGLSGGTLHGASDRDGALPAADPVTPPDLGQTILHLLGVPRDLVYFDPLGRPFPASPGQVVPGLLS